MGFTLLAAVMSLLSFLCIESRTQDPRSLPISITLPPSLLPSAPLPQMENEIRIMRHLYHRNVVLLFEVIDDPVEDSIFMIMEVRLPSLLPSFLPPLRLASLPTTSEERRIQRHTRTQLPPCPRSSFRSSLSTSRAAPPWTTTRAPNASPVP